MSEPDLTPVTSRERRIAVLLFFATLLSVFLVYGYQWAGGDPLHDAAVARESAAFAGTLMGILLAHEMGHYLVARRHGFQLSLPYFLPLPTAFGTFGAIIRLRSLPRSRTALLEMGAAGPLAGFAVAMVAMAIGLPATVAHVAPQMIASLPALPATPPPAPGMFESVLVTLLTHPPLSWLFELLSRIVPPAPDHTLPLMILANPPAMDVLGKILLGAAPGKYAELSPVAMAGWVGCLLTGINLLPIGQLDGGHVLNALAPRAAPTVARVGVALALLAGVFFWSGWMVWGVLLLVLRAWQSLPVPSEPAPTRRALAMAALALVAFSLSFMPRPLAIENLPLSAIAWVDENCNPTAPPTDPVDAVPATP